MRYDINCRRYICYYWGYQGVVWREDSLPSPGIDLRQSGKMLTMTPGALTVKLA